MKIRAAFCPVQFLFQMFEQGKFSLSQGSNIFRAPQSPDGIFQIPEVISQQYVLSQGRVSIERFDSDREGEQLTMVRIEPEMDPLTLQIINNRISQEGPNGAMRLSRILAQGMPTLQIAAGRNASCFFEEGMIGGFRKDGFWYKRDFFDDPEIVSKRIWTPETTRDASLGYGFEFYRVQDHTGFTDQNGNRLGAVIVPSFNFSAPAFEELSEKVLSLSSSAGEEEIRGIANVGLKIRLFNPAQIEDEGGDMSWFNSRKPDGGSPSAIY